MDGVDTYDEDTEKDQLLRKTRELLLRTKVLESHLRMLRRAKESTLEISQYVDASIQSTDDDSHQKLRLMQEQSLVEKHSRLDQLNHKLSVVKCQVFIRNKKMIGDLWDIYPIIEFPDRKGYSICDIHLPSSEHFEGHDETMVSVAIGYVGHLLLLLSKFMDITLRFPLRFYGSKSLIYCSRKNQLFPLFIESFKSREWVNFSYGMNLLNLDIVQIRTLHGLPTNDPEDTLANLHGLKLLIDNNE